MDGWMDGWMMDTWMDGWINKINRQMHLLQKYNNYQQMRKCMIGSHGELNN